MADSNFRGQSETYAEPGLHRRDSLWEEMAMNGRGDYIRKDKNFENFHHEGMHFRVSQSEGARSAIAPDAHATYLTSWQINRVTGSKVSHKAGWYIRHMAKWHITQLSGMQSTHMTHCHFRPFAGWPVKYLTRWDVTHMSRTAGTRLSGWKHSTGIGRPVNLSGVSGHQGCKSKPYGIISNDDNISYPNTLSIHSRCRSRPKVDQWTSRFSVSLSTDSFASHPVDTAWSSRYDVNNKSTLNTSFSFTPTDHIWASRYTINLPSSTSYTTSPIEKLTSRYKNMTPSLNSSYSSTPTEHGWSSKYNIHLPSGIDSALPPNPNDKIWTPRYSNILQPSVNNSYTSHQRMNTNFQCSANSRSYERLHTPRFDRPDDDAFDHSLNGEQEKTYLSAATTAMEWKENEQRKAWAAELGALMKKYNERSHSPTKHGYEEWEHKTHASIEEEVRRPEKKVTYKPCDPTSITRNDDDECPFKSRDLKPNAWKESVNRPSESTEIDNEVSRSVKTKPCRSKNAKSPTKKAKEKRADNCAVLKELIRKYKVGRKQESTHPKIGDNEDGPNSTSRAADDDDKVKKSEKRVTYSPIEPKTYTWKDSEHAEKKSSSKSADDNKNKSFRPEKYRSRQTWKYSDRKFGKTNEGEDITGNCDTKESDRAKSADVYDGKKRSEKKVTYHLTEQKPPNYKKSDSRSFKATFVDKIKRKYDARSRTYGSTEPLVFLRGSGEKRSRSSAEIESLLRRYDAGRPSSSTDVDVLMSKYDEAETHRSSDFTVRGAAENCSSNRTTELMDLMLRSGVNTTWGYGSNFSCSSTDPLILAKQDDLPVSKVKDTTPKSWSYDFKVWSAEVRNAIWRDALSSSWRSGMSGSWRNAFMSSWERPTTVFSDEQYRTWQEDVSISLSAVYSMGFRLTRAYVTHQLETNLRPSSNMD